LAYQAFYNKYRPQSFGEVVGQKAIVETLQNAIKENKIAHAYLFCGPRGTGKTTLARLFAKALNCKEGLGHQCNQCESCQSITRGDHPDVIEIDAASNSTVDSVRQLIDNVSYQPIMSRYKVYIIDEVHNMSNSAFNALLKTLEEPPSFVVFILATTEPQKIIPTILSRVQRFDFSKVSDSDIISNMEMILKKENVTYEKEALQAIASLADGGVRDSLSLLDQLVSYSGTNVTAQDVDNLFGLLSLKDELTLVHLLEDKKSDEVLKLVRDKYQKGMDVLRLHGDLIAIEKDLLLYQTTKDETLLNRLSKTDCLSFKQSQETLEANLRLLIEAKRDYRTADNILDHFELTLLSLMIGQSKATNVQSNSSSSKEGSFSDEKVLASKPILVETKSTGFESKPETKTMTPEEDKVNFTTDDLVTLMKHAVSREKVEERKTVSNQWGKLESQLVGERIFLARAISNSKLRLIGEDVLLVTSDILVEEAKIDSKANQALIQQITQETFGKPYHILAVSKQDFADAYALFKKTANDPMKDLTLDFGQNKATSSSTEFFNDLVSGKD
jgi:DNA polymerase III subunit gamma/tau